VLVGAHGDELCSRDERVDEARARGIQVDCAGPTYPSSPPQDKLHRT
jgi:hypothetical protein